jgi:hypothetical protein
MELKSSGFKFKLDFDYQGKKNDVLNATECVIFINIFLIFIKIFFLVQFNEYEYYCFNVVLGMKSALKMRKFNIS